MNRRIGSLLLGAGALATGAAMATPQTYLLDLPPNDMIAYRVQFHVTQTGPLELWADWSSHRVLSFRLDGPDGRAGARRSGPPPLSMLVQVDEELAQHPGPWTLTIRGLPSNQAAQGKFEVRFPEAVPPLVPPAPIPPEAAALPDRPWTRPRPVPPDLPADRARLFQTTERFRGMVVDETDASRDRYDWQQGFLRFIVGRRELAERGGPVLTAESRDTFTRIAEVIQRVEGFATSTDPLLAGPVPEDRFRHRVWLRSRNEILEPLERELDGLLIMIREKGPAELEDGEWLARFLSCVAACERYFDQRVRLGEEHAQNRELAAEQWERVRAAAAALGSLVALEPAPDGS